MKTKHPRTFQKEPWRRIVPPDLPAAERKTTASRPGPWCGAATRRPSREPGQVTRRPDLGRSVRGQHTRLSSTPTRCVVCMTQSYSASQQQGKTPRTRSSGGSPSGGKPSGGMGDGGGTSVPTPPGAAVGRGVQRTSGCSPKGAPGGGGNRRKPTELACKSSQRDLQRQQLPGPLDRSQRC